MGYQTDFGGAFAVSPPLKPEHREYLKKFNETRRMARDAEKAALLPDPVREAAGLPVGKDGEFFVGGTGLMGQDRDASVTQSNNPPGEQPSLWCQWVPNADGTVIEWDEGEKFYEYVEWLEYMVAHLFDPWGYRLNGEVWWNGEEEGDRGVIYIKDNEIEAVSDKIENPGPSWGKADEVAAKVEPNLG